MDRVAAAFGLRGVLIPHEHRTSPTWRLETSAGVYLVKKIEVEGREAAVARAASFERAVANAGVRVPRTLAPVGDSVGMATRVDGFGWVRAYEWIDARPPGDVSEWLGRTMAVIHALEPVPAPEPIVYGLHPDERWDEWLAAGERLGRPWAAPLRAGRRSLRDVAAWVAAALAGAGGYVFTHRDIEPWNVLLADDGPVLIDWDPAGPDCAGLEAGHAAYSFAPERPAPVLAAYLAAGGTLPLGETLFARRVGMRLNRLCWRLSMSARSPQPAEVDARAAEQIRGLPAFADELRHLAQTVVGL